MFYLQSWETFVVVLDMDLAAGTLAHAGPRSSDPEMELDIAHDARVGVREGEIADISLVLFRELVLGPVSRRVDALDDLPQLKVEGDHGDAVQPVVKVLPISHFTQLFLLS